MLDLGVSKRILFVLQVLTVYRLASTLIHPTIVEFGEHHGLPRQEVLSCIDRLVPHLLQKTGDVASRVRDVAKAQIVQMAQWPVVSCPHLYNAVSFV